MQVIICSARGLWTPTVYGKRYAFPTDLGSATRLHSAHRLNDWCCGRPTHLLQPMVSTEPGELYRSYCTSRNRFVGVLVQAFGRTAILSRFACLDPVRLLLDRMIEMVSVVVAERRC